MLDPVILQDQFTYERVMIEGWLARHQQHSPMTGLPLPQPIVMIPNAALREAIIEHLGSEAGKKKKNSSEESIKEALDKAEERLTKEGKTLSPATVALKEGGGAAAGKTSLLASRSRLL